ncbi:hypothetical protein [Caldalkalibacillus mannanilyticus]|uniref:hypothetical protein n=1 Tax=Caldalkalibacillus mannanilyticus TaxID=1418 RepID=UPI000469E1CC|nr:hypothetical protein [Caldalkalibacillus mannanilyticus]
MPIYIWAMKTGKIIDFVINKFIDGFNKVVELYNKVTGLSIDLVPEFSVGEFAKDVMGYLQTKKEEVYANAAQKAAERQARFSKPELPPIGTGTGRESGFGTGLETKGLGNIDTINKVGEVGQIRDSVDISSEDLKMMRELAEIKNVQNFVSLTPTVSVQTGDINQGYDIETIVSNITEKLETQIVSSARAVYDI